MVGNGQTNTFDLYVCISAEYTGPKPPSFKCGPDFMISRHNGDALATTRCVKPWQAATNIFLFSYLQELSALSLKSPQFARLRCATQKAALEGKYATCSSNLTRFLISAIFQLCILLSWLADCLPNEKMKRQPLRKASFLLLLLTASIDWDLKGEARPPSLIENPQAGSLGTK